MKASEFVAVLAAACPSRDELKAHGLEEDDVRMVEASFHCPVRDGSLGVPGRGEVFDLLGEYDCSHAEVSFVRFVTAPALHPHGATVAMWESDPVVVRADGTVAAYDHEVPDALLCVCAVSQERFLEALAVLVRAIAARNRVGMDAKEVAAECRLAAGTDDASRFFGPLCAFLGWSGQGPRPASREDRSSRLHVIPDELAIAMRDFISGRDRSMALANRIEVALDALGDEEPFAEAVIVLARYRPGGGAFLTSEDDVVAILTHVLTVAGKGDPSR